jgi:monoamine oxidase
MTFIRNLAERECQKIDIHDPVGTGGDLDKITLDEWARQHGAGKTAMASVTVWTRALLGVEPSDMSALYFLDYCKSGGDLMQMRSDKKDGGQHLRMVQGTQSISRSLAERLVLGSVILNSPVRAIEQTPDGVLVSAGRGDIFCQRVIVSVPTPLYQEITFMPPLPKAKQELSSSNKLGYQLKVVLIYAEPWWRAGNLCGLLQSFEGPVSVTRDSSVEETGQYSLTCFVPGKPGIALSRGTQQERFDAVLAQIARCFEPVLGRKVPQPITIAEHEWAKDQWAQGCPCPVSPPGVMTKFGHALRTPHEKVHFIGTETAFEWKGYMDGAVRSGERGAKEVIRILSRPRI